MTQDPEDLPVTDRKLKHIPGGAFQVVARRPRPISDADGLPVRRDKNMGDEDYADRIRRVAKKQKRPYTERELRFFLTLEYSRQAKLINQAHNDFDGSCFDQDLDVVFDVVKRLYTYTRERNRFNEIDWQAAHLLRAIITLPDLDFVSASHNKSMQSDSPYYKHDRWLHRTPKNARALAIAVFGNLANKSFEKLKWLIDALDAQQQGMETDLLFIPNPRRVFDRETGYDVAEFLKVEPLRWADEETLFQYLIEKNSRLLRPALDSLVERLEFYFTTPRPQTVRGSFGYETKHHDAPINITAFNIRARDELMAYPGCVRKIILALADSQHPQAQAGKTALTKIDTMMQGHFDQLAADYAQLDEQENRIRGMWGLD